MRERRHFCKKCRRKRYGIRGDDGTPGATRTHYIPLRRRTLYPGEVRGRMRCYCTAKTRGCQRRLSFEKYSRVSFATTPDRAKSATKFGIAIRPLKVSAMSQTKSTGCVAPTTTASTNSA